MKTRVLLINFTQAEADKIKVPPSVDIHRGYLSDLLPYEKIYNEEFNKTLGKMCQAYFPLAIHEYKVIFVKLHTVPGLEEEFEDKLESYHEKIVNDLINYILQGSGYLVVMLGNYQSAKMFHLGIQDITLHKTIGRDSTINTVNTEFNKVFERLESEVIMPTESYITVDDKEDDFYKKFSSSFTIKNIYKNQAGNVLGCYHNNSRYYGDCSPGFFLLPLFRNSNVAVAELLKEFSRHTQKFLPEFYQSDWQDSDDYLPVQVQEYQDKISKIIQKAESLIQEQKTKRDNARAKYHYLVELLSQKHDVLKTAVITTLQEVFKLPVDDSDAIKKTTLDHEDIVVQVGSEQILVEIKGDNASYPGTGHIAQLWKHLKNKKEIERGALILNYDVSTEPEKRKLAYTGEEKHQIADIIYIDTRALHDLAIAIIDYGMKPEDATKILFQNGRVTFNLDKHTEEFQSKNVADKSVSLANKSN